MSVKTKIFLCFVCTNGALSKDKIIHSGCQEPFCIVEADVKLKIQRTRWVRFQTWLYSRDIGFGLAMIGIIGLNGMLIEYLSLSFGQSIIEVLFLGLAMPRLLK